MNETLQALAVGLAVGWALLSVWSRYFPNARRTLQQQLALGLVAPGRAAVLRRLGRALLASPPTAAGCDSGCRSCDGCGSTAPRTQTNEQPLEFHRRR